MSADEEPKELSRSEAEKVLGPHEIGARIIHRNKLLDKQKKVVDRILYMVCGIADREARIESAQMNDPDHHKPLRETRRPSNTFLIDGQRGSGKTSLLLTVRRYLRVMNLGSFGTIYDAETKENLIDFSSTYQRELEAHIPVGAERRDLAVTLPVISPEEMETSQSVMEAVIAKMGYQLEDMINKKNPQQIGSEKVERAKELREELMTTVAKGWYFSRDQTEEALVRDSLNYKHYVRQRSEESILGHDRTGLWRAYVTKFLELYNSHLLIIFIDDTDTSAENTIDVLEAIRAFLHHPRVVTVLAGNLHSIRQSLLINRFKRAGDALQALRGTDTFSANVWRRYERQHVEEYLFKILPSQYRHFISPDKSDFRTVFSEDPYEYCRREMQGRLPAIVHRRCFPKDEVEDANRLDNYMAFWLLRGFYNQELLPEVARHLLYIKNQTRDVRDASEVTKRLLGRKRLAVMLFDMPTNYTLQHLMSESDHGLFDWLIQQKVESSWRGRRDLRINDVEVPEHTYTYNYLHFFLDLEISKPVLREHEARDVPQGALPKIDGSTVFAPEVWESSDSSSLLTAAHISDTYRLRQKRYGLAFMLESPLIAANCLYLKDLSAQPDLTWRAEGAKTSETIWGLYPTKRVDNLYDIDKDDSRLLYFAQVVLLLGSVPIREPVPATEFSYSLDGMLHEYELGTAKLPNGINGMEEVFGDELGIDGEGHNNNYFFKRAREVLGDIISKSFELESNRPITSDDRRRISTEYQLHKLCNTHSSKYGMKPHVEVYGKFLRGPVSRYVRITNDTRRAFSSLRAFQNELHSLRLGEIADLERTPKDQRTEAHKQKIKRLTESLKDVNQTRRDRIRLIGITEIRSRLGIGSFVGEAGNRVLGDHPTLRKYFESKSPFDLFKPQLKKKHLRGLLDDDLEPYVCGDETLAEVLDRLVPNNDLTDDDDRANALLELFLGHSFGQPPTDEAVNRVRTYRSLCLFFWGLGPCLTSLIHLDLIGEVYKAHHSRQDLDDVWYRIKEKVRLWLDLLRQMQMFAITYGNVAEQIVINMHVWVTLVIQEEKGRELSEEDSQLKEARNIGYILSTDISNTTMGLRLGPGGEPSSNHKPSGRFQGIIGDILSRSCVAELFLARIYKDLVALKKSSAEAEDSANESS